jgi:hypothetical protein
VSGLAPRALRDCVPSAPPGASVRPLNFTVRRLAVPTYDVIVQGQGIRVPIGAAVAVGFFRVIRVSASDQRGAEQSALSRAKSDWDSSGNAKLNHGAAPMLTIDSIAELPWWRRFLQPKRGYIFFPEERGSNAV